MTLKASTRLKEDIQLQSCYDVSYSKKVAVLFIFGSPWLLSAANSFELEDGKVRINRHVVSISSTSELRVRSFKHTGWADGLLKQKPCNKEGPYVPNETNYEEG